MKLNRKEVLRYLGYGLAHADDKTVALIDEAEREISLVARPKHIYSSFNLTILENNRIDFTCFQTVSGNLTKNLQDCSKAILFAATLGAEVDQLIRKYNRVQISKAVVLQAISAAYIEGYCNEINEMIKQQYKEKGWYLRPRYSPGYGDFSLEHQRDIINVLQCPKKIGLTLTDSLVMMPSKSVTAIIGISSKNQFCHLDGCEVCQKTNCIYRRG